jgi:drug/metabolite transporter (DMT)-like permease
VTPAPSRAAPIVAAAAIVIWGASAVAGKVAVQEMPALAVAFLRTGLAGIAALPLALALRIALPRGGAAWFLLLLSAACAFILFPVLFSLGIARTSASHAAMILAVSPLLTGAIAQAWDRAAPPGRWWLGGAIALAGEVLLIQGRDAASAHHAGALLGDVLVAGAALVGALGYVAGGRLNRFGYPAQGATYWGIVLASLALLPALPWMMPPGTLQAASPLGLASLAYLAFAVTILGYILWYWALGHGGIARIGMMQFAQPVVSVALAALLLAERLGPAALLGSAAVLAGVWIATRPGSTIS